jgi:STAM-binding protein
MATLSSKRPLSIDELTDLLALESLNVGGPSDLKHHLRMIEKHCMDGNDCYTSNDLEGAFIAYARAATLLLERVPSHRDYTDRLTPEQRQLNTEVSFKASFPDRGH